VRILAVVTLEGGTPYVEAEVAVPDYLSTEEARRHVGEVGLYGPAVMLSTREELADFAQGRRALATWDARDDRALTDDHTRDRDRSNRADVGMLARRGDRRAIALLRRKASPEEIAEWLREDAAASVARGRLRVVASAAVVDRKATLAHVHRADRIEDRGAR
jgi:hypothetical protein